MSIRVLVVDDSGFFRRRVTEIINADPRMEVVGVAANGQEAIEKTTRCARMLLPWITKCR